MTQIVEYACPDITCRAFGEPWPIECYDDGEMGGWPEFDMGGTPECDDDGHCGGCGCRTVPMTEFHKAWMRRVGDGHQYVP